MRKADRLFQLVNLIRIHQPVTAAKLAELLQISVRSVYRYIDDLSLSDVPIYGEPEVGYRLQEGFELPPLTFTNDEMDALLLAIEMLSIGTGKRLPLAANSLLHKIQASLPRNYNLLRQNGLHAIALSDRVFQSELWDQLLHAIQFQLRVTIHYNSLQERESVSEVSPLGLFYWGGKWTLATWCELRDDYRSFRLDRISNITITNHYFEYTSMINLDSYMDYQNRRCLTLQ